MLSIESILTLNNTCMIWMFNTMSTFYQSIYNI